MFLDRSPLELVVDLIRRVTAVLLLTRSVPRVGGSVGMAALVVLLKLDVALVVLRDLHQALNLRRVVEVLPPTGERRIHRCVMLLWVL